MQKERSERIAKKFITETLQKEKHGRLSSEPLLLYLASQIIVSVVVLNSCAINGLTWPSAVVLISGYDDRNRLIGMEVVREIDAHGRVIRRDRRAGLHVLQSITGVNRHVRQRLLIERLRRVRSAEVAHRVVNRTAH